ncbi:hypothetical protein [Nostoc sp.]
MSQLSQEHLQTIRTHAESRGTKPNIYSLLTLIALNNRMRGA